MATNPYAIDSSALSGLPAGALNPYAVGAPLGSPLSGDYGYDDGDVDVEVVSPSGYARYALFRFLGLAIWSHANVASTLLRVQYLPNAATRSRLAHLGSSSSGDEGSDLDADHEDDDNETDFASDGFASDGPARGGDDLDFLLSQPSTAMSSVPSTSAPSRVDDDGYVVHSYADDAATRPLTMLPPLTGGLWSTVRAVRRHPEEGTLALYKALFTDFARHMLAETMEPTLCSSACDSLGIDDTLLPVDHDNPIPISLVALVTSVGVDFLLSPFAIACTRLAVQTSRPERKYRGFLHALRAQFLDVRSNPYMNLTLVLPTLAASAVGNGFALFTPLLIDRVLGVSETYNPIRYAVYELVLKTVRDLALLPLQTAQARLYAQPAAHPRDGRDWVAIVPQAPVPYTGIRDCLVRTQREEGGARAEHRADAAAAKAGPAAVAKLAGRRARRNRKLRRRGSTGASELGLWWRLEPLYQGLGLRMASNVAYFLMRVMTEYIEVTLDDDEF
ncbi:hypothetical protein H9P43_003783 [Blastocladiella emersonii ATCC 22665]|nr:hypothetical protein H9P43_003783 [Blastocladiella emersonii ATCC 22665]